MSKRDELIEKYAGDLKNKLGVTPDMDLLRKVTIGCGPSIYNRDSSTCLLYTSPSPRDRTRSRMPSSA